MCCVLNGVSCDTTTGFIVTQIVRGSEWGMEYMKYFSHMFALFSAVKMGSELYPFFHIAMLNDFDLTFVY